MNISHKLAESLWQEFAKDESLTDEQLKQFQEYYLLLTIWNKKMNLTTILDVPGVIDYHFRDSLALGRAVPMEDIRMIADIGSGAGFPGIPLKIKYPHLSCVLIEVNQKKVSFLRMLIEQLKLENIEVVDIDLRTFLRQSDYPIDLFCARASLPVEELVRTISPAYAYGDGTLVYWAAANWHAPELVSKYALKETRYVVGDKTRKLIVITRKN